MVLEPVGRALRLYLRPASPADAAALASLEATGEPLRPGTYRLLAAPGAYRLRDAGGATVDEAPPGAPLGAPLGFRWVPPERAARVDFEIVPPHEAVRELLGQLRVRTDREGSFMRLQLRGASPEHLAAVVNAVAERFVALAADLKRQRLNELVRILRGQVDVATQNRDRAEAALKDFRLRSAGALTQGGGPTVPGVSITADPLFAGYIETRMTRDQLVADREAIERALVPQPGGGPSVQALEQVGSVQRSGALMQALRDLTAREAELRALRSRYTDDHPSVRRLATEVRALERQTIPALAGDLADGLRAREEELGRLVQASASNLRRVSPLAVEEARLRWDVEVAGELLANLRQRYEEARLAEVSSIPDVRLLDAARPPAKPASHLGPVLVVLAFLGSLGAGVGGAVLRQVVDRKVRAPEEVTTQLGMRILGAVPHLRRSDDRDVAPALEGLRVIRLNLMHAYGAAGPIAFTVTSAGGSEGKSFIACNLALSFADAGYRTLLVDGDTRRGRLHRLLNAARRPGLTDQLAGRLAVEAVIQRTAHAGLSFVGCGSRMRTGPELLTAPNAAACFAVLRSLYDVIITDSPPLAAGVDPYALATLTGNALLVVRTGVTDRQLAEAKLDVLTRLPVRLLGAVLNDARMIGPYRYLSYYMAGYGLEDEEDTRGGDVPQVLRSSE
ncbi:MAG TPA: GNVR domain-containing protein [bacterium]|nr:GNVR domain-containing protein [bacterium]